MKKSISRHFMYAITIMVFVVNILFGGAGTNADSYAVPRAPYMHDFAQTWIAQIGGGRYTFRLCLKAEGTGFFASSRDDKEVPRIAVRPLTWSLLPTDNIATSGLIVQLQPALHDDGTEYVALVGGPGSLGFGEMKLTLRVNPDQADPVWETIPLIFAPEDYLISRYEFLKNEMTTVMSQHERN